MTLTKHEGGDMMSYNPLQNLDLPLYYQGQHLAQTGGGIPKSGEVYIYISEQIFGPVVTDPSKAYKYALIHFSGYPPYYYKVPLNTARKLSTLIHEKGMQRTGKGRHLNADLLKSVNLNYSSSNLYEPFYKGKSVVGTFKKGKPLYLSGYAGSKPLPTQTGSIARSPSPFTYKGVTFSVAKQRSIRRKRIARDKIRAKASGERRMAARKPGLSKVEAAKVRGWFKGW